MENGVSKARVVDPDEIELLDPQIQAFKLHSFVIFKKMALLKPPEQFPQFEMTKNYTRVNDDTPYFFS